MKETPFINPKTDPLYLALQEMYTRLGKIAREVVFVPQIHFKLELGSTMSHLLRQIYNNGSLEMFRVPYRVGSLFYKEEVWIFADRTRASQTFEGSS
jgi:hypothetical protein